MGRPARQAEDGGRRRGGSREHQKSSAEAESSAQLDRDGSTAGVGDSSGRAQDGTFADLIDQGGVDYSGELETVGVIENDLGRFYLGGRRFLRAKQSVEPMLARILENVWR